MHREISTEIFILTSNFHSDKLFAIVRGLKLQRFSQNYEKFTMFTRLLINLTLRPEYDWLN